MICHCVDEVWIGMGLQDQVNGSATRSAGSWLSTAPSA